MTKNKRNTKHLHSLTLVLMILTVGSAAISTLLLSLCIVDSATSDSSSSSLDKSMTCDYIALIIINGICMGYGLHKILVLTGSLEFQLLL